MFKKAHFRSVTQILQWWAVTTFHVQKTRGNSSALNNGSRYRGHYLLLWWLAADYRRPVLPMALHKDSSPYYTGPITLTIVRGDSESQPSRTTTLSRSHVRMTGRCCGCFTTIAPPQCPKSLAERKACHFLFTPLHQNTVFIPLLWQIGWSSFTVLNFSINKLVTKRPNSRLKYAQDSAIKCIKTYTGNPQEEAIWKTIT